MVWVELKLPANKNPIKTDLVNNAWREWKGVVEDFVAGFELAEVN